MIEFLSAPQNAPFLVALVALGAVSLLEGLAAVVGFGISNAIDSWLDFDLPDVDVDLDLDADADAALGEPGVVGSALGWLFIGKVPFMALVVVYLGTFGAAGVLGQLAFRGVTGVLVPGWIAVWPATAVGLVGVHYAGRLLANILPKEETSAVESESFVGKVAVISIGTARAGQPAQAKLKDEHGRTHWVMVEPDDEREQFGTGDPMLLTRMEGARFRGIRPPQELLES